MYSATQRYSTTPTTHTLLPLQPPPPPPILLSLLLYNCTQPTHHYTTQPHSMMHATSTVPTTLTLFVHNSLLSPTITTPLNRATTPPNPSAGHSYSSPLSSLDQPTALPVASPLRPSVALVCCLLHCWAVVVSLLCRHPALVHRCDCVRISRLLVLSLSRPSQPFTAHTEDNKCERLATGDLIGRAVAGVHDVPCLCMCVYYVTFSSSVNSAACISFSATISTLCSAVFSYTCSCCGT